MGHVQGTHSVYGEYTNLIATRFSRHSRHCLKRWKLHLPVPVTETVPFELQNSTITDMDLRLMLQSSTVVPREPLLLVRTIEHISARLMVIFPPTLCLWMTGKLSDSR